MLNVEKSKTFTSALPLQYLRISSATRPQLPPDRPLNDKMLIFILIAMRYRIHIKSLKTRLFVSGTAPFLPIFSAPNVL